MKKHYVVWDGVNELDYAEDFSRHDCMVLYDGLLSVQKLRRAIIKLGKVPTIVFGCKSGQTVEELEIQGKVVGFFSHYFIKVLDHNPHVTFRDAVRLINEAAKQENMNQICEVICRADVLDMEVLYSSLPKTVHVLMILDMCRAASES